jgi:hypothetical protein
MNWMEQNFQPLIKEVQEFEDEMMLFVPERAKNRYKAFSVSVSTHGNWTGGTCNCGIVTT